MESQTHLAKNDLEDVLQTEDTALLSVPAQHDGQPLAAALHPLQRHFQSQVLIQIERGLDELSHRPRWVQPRLVEERVEAEQTHDPLLPFARFPDRQAGELAL